MKKIVGFAGSNSSKSINKQLVKYAISAIENVETKVLDLNDYEMPIFSIDREEKGFPKEAYAFRKEMENADAIVCSIAEHNRTYSVAMKNILDWCSRIDLNIFYNKPMLLMTTAPGGYGGGNVMQVAHKFFPRCGAEVIDTFSLPKFHENFKNEAVINKEYKAELLEKINRFTQYIDR